MINSKLILPNLCNFLLTRNLKDKLNIVFELYQYYSNNKENIISNVNKL